MRIIAGEFRGRKLQSPEGINTRPTSDRVRESLFNILGASIIESRVLDLFAGTGALGIEALSRGASYCVFADKDKKSIEVININIQSLGLEQYCEILHLDATNTIQRLRSNQEKFDLIFLDPPYLKGLIDLTINLVMDCHLLNPGGIIVVEHSKEEKVEDEIKNIKLIKQRVYGNTILSFYSTKEE